MSVLKPPSPAKPVVGIFLKDRALLPPVARELSGALGPIDMASPWFPFGFTAYYEKEMGAPLFRRLLVFKRLIAQDALGEIKHTAVAIEQSYLHENKRRVNIDPGYLLLERFVLATGKNFAHRIYIGHNVYADLTLTFSAGAYQTLPWTYPDYASNAMREFLLQVRRKYSMDLKHRDSGPHRRMGTDTGNETPSEEFS